MRRPRLSSRRPMRRWSRRCKSYGAWMKSDLLPRSNGDFRYGADTFRKALAYSEMVDIPLDRLLAIGYDDLHKNQAEFARVAKEIDPSQDSAAGAGRAGDDASGAGPICCRRSMTGSTPR